MEFATLNDWIQFGAAVATILVTPWAINSVRLFVRSQIKAFCWQNERAPNGSAWEWVVEIRRRSRITGPIEIVAYPSTNFADVSSCFVLEPRDKHVVLNRSIEGGKLKLSVDFWPTLRPIKLLVRMSNPDYLEFSVDGKSQPVTFDVDKASSKISGNRAVGISTAQIRFTMVTLQFAMLSAAALLRIAYLGFFGRGN